MFKWATEADGLASTLRSVAQVVEHWSPKPKVVGSSPAGPGEEFDYGKGHSGKS